jgi:hypothetical protein
MHRLVCPFVLAAALLGQSPSSDVSISIWPFLEGNMDGRIPEIVTNCVTYGMDTVYVSTFRATASQYGTLWIDDSAGDWNPAWGPVRTGGTGINLQNLITACHAQNIRVVAILKCFHDTVQPTDAAHRQYLLDVVDYLVNAYRPDGTPVYDLDGIALDYVRFVGSSGAVDPTVVTDFVRDVKAVCGHLSLHAYLIASRYTFDGGTYNGSFQTYATVINSLASQYGQHWEQMSRHVDVLMPMAYTANGSIYNTNALHQAYVRQTAAYARTACTNAGYPTRRVAPTIRTYSDSSETATVGTIDASITGALLGGADGYQSFRYEFLVTNPTWWTPMQQYAVPGCNWPLPLLGTTLTRLSVTGNPTASRDADQASTSLQVRFDWQNDRVFDTPWLPNAVAQTVARYPGTWQCSLQVRDSTGHVATTRRQFTAGPAIAIVPASLSAGSGGAAQLRLEIGPNGAGHVYLALATMSGTQPGFLWQPGFPVPINVDFLTAGFAGLPNGGFLNGGLGTFDLLGRATATLTTPPGLLLPLIGVATHWSFLCADAFGQPVCVGEAAALAIVP